MNKMMKKTMKITDKQRRNSIRRGIVTITGAAAVMALYAFTFTSFAASFAMPQGLTNVITFFVSMVKIAGGVVGFIGAVMFFLGVKSDDAHQKQQGLFTLIAGAGVFGVATAVTSGQLFG